VRSSRAVRERARRRHIEEHPRHEIQLLGVKLFAIGAEPRFDAIIASWFFCGAFINARTSIAPLSIPPPSHAARDVPDEHRLDARLSEGSAVAWMAGCIARLREWNTCGGDE
jgi:hypothetical protein